MRRRTLRALSGRPAGRPGPSNEIAPRLAARGLRALGVAAALWAGASCHEPLDTTRQAPPKATLGDDLYGLLCDRVGASSLVEDLSGASYQAVCHYDDDGHYGDTVDTSLLPPVSGEKSKEARRLGIAKVEAMARRRSELIRAFNAAFPDTEIDNVATEKEGDTIRLHDALLRLTQAMAPLYEQNPYEAGETPLLPASTRSLARLFNALADSQPARDALSKVWGRQGYRPTGVVLGAIRGALGYPGLRDLTKASVEVLGPDGVAVPALQQLLTVSKQELSTAKTNVSALPELVVNAALAEPSRPRSNIEVMAALLTAQDDVFAASDTTPRAYIVQRDRRGFVRAPAAAPFADVDGDGLADVDPFGRFVDASGAPLAIDPPFVIPGLPSGPADAYGRPSGAPYAYIDTSRTLAGALSRTFAPLVDATQYVAPGDPNGYKSEHEGMMYALAGAYLLYGDREDATYDHDAEAILPAGSSCARCTPYLRFRGEDSPVADLAHAAGQILADEDSDAILLSVVDLLENHEQTVARLVGAALRARAIAAEHDKLAAQGKEALAEMPYETPIWDEVAEVLGRIAERPGLAARLIRALGDPALVTPRGGSDHVGDTITNFLLHRDELTYNPADINGPPINVTMAGVANLDPQSPVDQTQPKTGDNRSCLQRSFQIIHDANQVKACNKEGAKVYANLGFELYWPLIGDYSECELFSFDNLATFYIDSLLPDNHPKRSYLEIKSGTLNAILSFLGLFVSPDTLLEGSSGVVGMNLHPTPSALNRLVFFGADSDNYPNLLDFDILNQGSKTNKFISNLIEPVCGVVGQPDAQGVPQCQSQQDLFRLRGANTIFLWERRGFYDYLRPLVEAFADEPCGAGETDVCGEQMFVDLIDILNRHWPGPEHGPECKGNVAKTDPWYCSEAGVNTYEALAADVFASDMIPAIVEFSRAAAELSTVTVQRGPKAGQVWTGAEVLEKITRVLFSKQYAASVNMVDRKGEKTTQWVDGTPQGQLTAFSLFTDALHKIDVRFDTSADPDAAKRKGQWKRARSEMVDAFFAVDGEGAAAKFKNRSTPRMLRHVIELLRQQLNANCKDREATGQCDWAKSALGDKVAETLSGPMFAAMMDVQEALRAHEPSRRELEKLLTYLLDAAGGDASFQALLASLTDIAQIIANDDVFAPIFQAAATASNPAGDAEGPGCADTTIKALKALTDDRYDAHHALDHVLPALVTPMDDGKAPIEVFLDVIAEVNRIDASTEAPLAADDYRQVFGTVRDFFTDETRGLEQFYTIVQNRPRE